MKMYDRCIFVWSTVCPLSILCVENIILTPTMLLSLVTAFPTTSERKVKRYGDSGAGESWGTPNIDQNGEAFGLFRLCLAMFELLLALEGIFSNFEQEFCVPKQFLTKI